MGVGISIVVGIDGKPLADRPNVCHAFNLTRVDTSFAEGGQDDADEQGDDGNHHEKLKERETGPDSARTAHGGIILEETTAPPPKTEGLGSGRFSLDPASPPEGCAPAA